MGDQVTCRPAGGGSHTKLPLANGNGSHVTAPGTSSATNVKHRAATSLRPTKRPISNSAHSTHTPCLLHGDRLLLPGSCCVSSRAGLRRTLPTATTTGL